METERCSFQSHWFPNKYIHRKNNHRRLSIFDLRLIPRESSIVQTIPAIADAREPRKLYSIIVDYAGMLFPSTFTTKRWTLNLTWQCLALGNSRSQST